jgi:MFS superfamily sulfate permease-like transporter
MTPWDGRYEDLKQGSVALNVARDAAAGLVVAMVAIPLAMGFAMASGLRPEQGIVGGAIAGAVGALFGGSKYQVYGPTAAFIPLIAAIMAKHGQAFLVLASLLAGLVLIAMGVARAGRLVGRVPHSIVVGFTIGISFVIAGSALGDMMGLHAKMPIDLAEKLAVVWQHRAEINWYAVVLALATFGVTKVALRISPFIPAPLIALGVGTWIAETAWAEKGLVNIKEKYASIPTDFWVFATPAPIQWTLPFMTDLVFFVAAIVFVSGVESLLCSRMADRLAGNDRTPFHPNKELWGQGWVQVIVPLLNGFPHTGALARTAANIRLGAISPLAGIFKAVFKLLLAAFLATHLEMVPMACIGGILLYVAIGMVKWQEVEEVLSQPRFHVFLMAWTAVAVAATDFLKGVMSALVLWLLLRRWMDRPQAMREAEAA